MSPPRPGTRAARGAGYHELRWLEYGYAGGGDTQTWYGDNNNIFLQTGIAGETTV
jgi:hypothetical protein